VTVEEQAAGIRANLEMIQARIALAERENGHEPGRVRLVVVTKGQPVEVTRAAILAGAALFGENYPEEALPKIEALRNEGSHEWHMIGHLQSRKARIVAEHFDMLHSLDSVKLAEKLERILAELQRKLPVLLEVNVGEEESKYGWPAAQPGQWEALLPVVDRIRQLEHLHIAGLMTMPPLFDDPAKSRPYFQRLHSLREYLRKHFADLDFPELSMGTSVDFETAIAEGATFVRIGTAVVGPRQRY
jgi:PLP dependent protein